MGAFIAKEMSTVSRARDACFMVERLIDANCEFLGGEQSIRVGIWAGPPKFKSEKRGPAGWDEEDEMAKKANPLGHQGIRIGAMPIMPLVGFTKHIDSVAFQFGGGIQLSIMRRANGDVYYHLIVPDENLDITRKISDPIRRHFKPIGSVGDAALEIDTIKDVFELR